MDFIWFLYFKDAVENLKNSFKNQFEISFRIDEYNRVCDLILLRYLSKWLKSFFFNIGNGSICGQ